jgi:hypothetical protein
MIMSNRVLIASAEKRARAPFVLRGGGKRIGVMEYNQGNGRHECILDAEVYERHAKEIALNGRIPGFCVYAVHFFASNAAPIGETKDDPVPTTKAEVNDSFHIDLHDGMAFSRLRAIAKDHGIDYSKLTTAKVLIDAIEDARKRSGVKSKA